jgi:hypothetical protein
MFEKIKKILAIIASIGIIILIVFGVIWIRKMSNKATQAANAAIFMREHPVEVVSVVRKELSALYPYIDSVIKAAGLNEKHVEKITTIYTKYNWDSIPGTITFADSGSQILNVAMTKDCFKAAGLIDFSGTKIKLTHEDLSHIKFHMTGVTVTDTTTTVYYFTRDIKKILFIPLRIGRKRYFSQTYSKCNAKTQTQSINLIKR